jgi:hypothetical protein
MSATTDAVVLYSGELDVCYAQFYVVTAGADQWIDMKAAFAGQTNGLCGSGQSGRLFFVTGTHTGKVRVTVEYTTTRPDFEATWEEQVECSFEVKSGGPTVLADWEGEQSHALQLSPRIYRVRYSARGMLADWEANPNPHDLQCYRIQLWPSPSRPDEILRVNGECAKYWHAEVAKSGGLNSDA